MAQCRNCGRRVPSDAIVCPYCASRLQAGVPAPAGAHTGPQTILVQGGGGRIPVSRDTVPGGTLTFTFLERGVQLAKCEVNLARDTQISFGREGCDVDVRPPSMTVSGRHATIFVRGGQCYLRDDNSKNGLYLNGQRQSVFRVSSGDVVTVGAPRPGRPRTVILVGDADMRWESVSLAGIDQLDIGRFADNGLVIANPTVSAHHARIARTPDGAWTICDLRSSNGTQVGSRFVTPGAWERLNSGSTISLGNARMVFLDACLLLFKERQGVDVACEGLVRYRKNKGRTIVTTDHVALHIKRGEFVAIVGGSGSGKSTLLNELNGSEPADEGRVTIDGVDLYANYDNLKTSIGYVPQQDIVYDNLTLESMLRSAAKLRMTPDSTAAEREARVNEIIDLLELGHVRTNLIGRLSGGQKKRASIAVELLADPRLLFLDEPTSGLDPGIERRLMQTLSSMAHDGRTIILVTHTTLNLHLCDQVVFLGQGGKLCYAGRPEQATSFFGVTDLVDAYNKISEAPERWQQQFAKTRERLQPLPTVTEKAGRSRRLPSKVSQFFTLSGRYLRLILNDRSRLLLLLAQGPLLAAVIALVASKDCFAIYERGKSCMFALSCAAFWLGVFDSIQEVCKERDIFLREYGGGVRLGAYVASKVVVLGGLCVLQAAMLCATFLAVCDHVGKAGGTLTDGCLLSSGPLEMMVTTTLLTVSAMCLGLLVSALFDNPDRAIAMAPLLIMPQILFAGVVFKLDPGSISERASYAVNCRWGMEALGTTLDLDAKDLAMYGREITIPAQDKEIHDLEVEVPATQVQTDFGPYDIEARTETIDSYTAHIDEQTKVIDAEMLEHDPQDLDGGMFEHSTRHLLRAWGIMAVMSVICTLGSHLALWRATRR